MPENILVVEYEPRYTDRVKQALAGQPIVPSFAKDGDEALRALDGDTPKLIVLSSVVPKVSTSDLIRVIRGRTPLADTPILVTVSGYQGKSPKADAQRMGASDILPKPYSESEFLGKIQQMLGFRPDSATMKMWAPELDPEFTARPSGLPNRTDGQLTSNEIFGELLEDDHRAASSGAKRPMAKQQDDLDKMLADTLAGVRAPKKKEGAPEPAATPKPAAAPPAAAPAAPPQPKTAGGTSNLDKMLNDTLSGLEPRAKMKTQAGNVPIPQTSTPSPQPAPPQTPRPTPPPAAPPPVQRPAGATTDPKFTTARLPTLEAMEKVPASQPVFMQPPAAAPVEEEPVDGVRFGQYVLVEKIATGGMAEVWKARMRGVEGFQKIVAIKKILPHLSDNQDFVEMFIDEAKLAAQLNHNNIIHIYDLGKIQSSYYIAMEYIDGHDLKTILKRGEERDTPMTVEIALFVASKIAAALDYAHRKHDFEGKEMGLVHRDVSPQNVLISQEGDIKLCDFGIAKAASKASHTQAGALKGKLQYMSPEQAWGRNIDRRSDVFALATVLFEMLTGRKLFSGDNELSILEQVREARIVPPSQFNDEVTSEIDKIVQKALQKDPAGRYQTAGEMQRDLDAVLYTFRPTPTSADLAIYMHRLLTSAPVMHEAPSSASFSAPMAAPMPHHEPESADPFQLKPMAPVKPAATILPPITPTPAAAAPVAVPAFGSDTPPKKSKAVPIAAAVVIPLAIAGAWFATRKPAATTPAAATTTHAAATTTAPATASVAPATSTTVTTGSLPATSTTLDPARVEEEVRKRLAAEKTRLDQQAKAQATTTTTPAATPQARATPTPAAPVPQPPAAVPAPAPQPVAETRPTPPPAPVPQPQPAAPAPAPAAERVREGDLVQAGTEGLVVPRMTRQAPVSYPPVARIQRAEGTVLMSVLVSEGGQVMDVKVIRGDARLNDAAVQAVRRSSFSPGTKDGVRVKSWVPVNISFKL
jgi:TonB family protein